MPYPFEALTVANPAALLGLLLIVPLVILYLLKPKPKHVLFPSLMLIKRVERVKSFRYFFKRFIHDPMLIIQIIAITLLVFSIVDMSYKAEEVEDVAESVVLVLDGSASMQAMDTKPNRFGEAVYIAESVVGKMSEDDSVSIVLAENVPILLLKNGKPDKANIILPKLSGVDTPSNIGDAILFSKDILAGENKSKVIYVLSDFAEQKGLDPLVAKKRAMDENISLAFIRVGSSGMNTGVTKISARRLPSDKNKGSVEFTVSNFDQTKDVTVKIFANKEEVGSMTKKLNINSDELFHFEYPAGFKQQLIEVHIENEDGLSVDNTAHAIIPPLERYNILLVSDGSYGDDYIKFALESNSNAVVQVAKPPVVPELNIFDTVIFGSFRSDDILPGTFQEMDSYVRKGGNVIFTASNNLNAISSRIPYMPVAVDNLVGRESQLVRAIGHELTEKKEVDLQESIVKEYYMATPKGNTTVLVKTTDGTPLIAYGSYGKGKVFYMGVSSNPLWSNFYYSSSYPIFWKKLVEWINIPAEDEKTNAYKTGDYLVNTRENTTVITPSGKKITSNTLLLDEAGIYRIQEGSKEDTIIVNLEDRDETDLRNIINPTEFVKSDKFRLTERTVQVDKHLTTTILILLITLLVYEAFYYRKRGYYEK